MEDLSVSAVGSMLLQVVHSILYALVFICLLLDEISRFNQAGQTGEMEGLSVSLLGSCCRWALFLMLCCASACCSDRGDGGSYGEPF
jgi:hypothetical protein